MSPFHFRLGSGAVSDRSGRLRWRLQRPVSPANASPNEPANIPKHFQHSSSLAQLIEAAVWELRSAAKPTIFSSGIAVDPFDASRIEEKMVIWFYSSSRFGNCSNYSFLLSENNSMATHQSGLHVLIRTSVNLNRIIVLHACLCNLLNGA